MNTILPVSNKLLNETLIKMCRIGGIVTSGGSRSMAEWLPALISKRAGPRKLDRPISGKAASVDDIFNGSRAQVILVDDRKR